jgi:hypothetical protein
MNNDLNCRFCGGALAEFVDFGMSPLCESYLAKDQLNSMEPIYPLAAYVCRDCLLVQLQEYVAPEHIFSEYAYFSAYSDSWLDHAQRYVETSSASGRLAGSSSSAAMTAICCSFLSRGAFPSLASTRRQTLPGPPKRAEFPHW